MNDERPGWDDANAATRKDDAEASEPPVRLHPLARTVDPPERLEERLVATLRSEGLVRDRARTQSTPWRIAAVAAGLALFTGGFAAGQLTNERSIAETVAALQALDGPRRAEVVQQTGSLYVRAMTSLHADREGDPGVEVALATLRAAAYELVRLDPDDARLRQVLTLLEREREAPGPGGEARTVLWF